ncbi:MAG: ATP-grasp domain-containing protein [Candidatus Moranbacteria bacterium]|nr:ATP-grasp domain-containing protein [Candidatus Moranbacteria bacterium]
MKICIIALGKKDYAPKRIYDEGGKAGHSMYLTTWDDIVLKINKKDIYFGDGGKSFAQFDAIIPRNCKCIIRPKEKKVTLRRNTLLDLLVEFSNKHGFFLLNKNFLSGYQKLDKLSQQFFLAENDLPGIPSCYFFNKKNIGKLKVEYPTVAKIADGSLGAQVYKINKKKELYSFLRDRHHDGEFFLFQKYLEISEDYRVLVIGNKVAGVMKRSPKKGEWRTNFSLGGTVSRAEKNKEMVDLALRVAQKMKLDYVGVDILRHKNKLYIIEINPFAQFSGFEKAFPEINVAKNIINLIEKKNDIASKNNN